MPVRLQLLQAAPCRSKGDHPLQSRSMGGLIKDNLPCVCVVALAVIGT